MVGGRDGLREPELDYLQRLRDRSVPFFDERRGDGRWWCRFGGYVGAIVLPGGRTLELLPKLKDDAPEEERALVMRMLAATELAPALEAELARYASSPHLLEVYLAVAADLGRSALRQGLLHAYERHRFESPAVRGRLRIAAQLARYPGRYDALLVEADVFTPDTPINRAIKAGVGRIARLTQMPGTLALCRELLTRLDAVGDLSPKAVGPTFDSLSFDRRSARLRPLVEILALIMRDRGSAAAAAPDAPGPAWLFAMDRLWERFVARRLSQLLPGLEVTEQGPARPLMTNGAFEMRPDIVVAAAGRVCMVLDTKWKVLTTRSTWLTFAKLMPMPVSIIRVSWRCYTRPGPTGRHLGATWSPTSTDKSASRFSRCHWLRNMLGNSTPPSCSCAYPVPMVGQKPGIRSYPLNSDCFMVNAKSIELGVIWGWKGIRISKNDGLAGDERQTKRTTSSLLSGLEH